MLIASPRYTRADLEAWAHWERQDAAFPKPILERRSAAARAEMVRFAARGPCYVGVSWGKDSVVVAHLALGLGLPLVWIRVEPIVNPDCAAVRDAFLASNPGVRYSEIEEWCTRDTAGWHATGTLERGFARAPARRYISGIRAEESSARERRVNGGLATEKTCAPIGRWTSIEVFAYLYAHQLPVHPAYACTFGGVLDRGRVRVSSLGGERGGGRGRAQWEGRYYGDALRAIAAATGPAEGEAEEPRLRARRRKK